MEDSRFRELMDAINNLSTQQLNILMKELSVYIHQETVIPEQFSELSEEEFLYLKEIFKQYKT